MWEKMNKRYKENFLYAGRLAKEVRLYGKSLILNGSSYNQVLLQVNQKIRELGAIPAFPPQIALNQVAAHFLLPPGEDWIFSNEIVKLDIGVCYEGAIADCAVTVDLSGRYQKLVEAVEEALLRAEKIIKVGVRTSEIGKVIDETIQSYGFKAVKNLSGHGLAPYTIHTSPTIPNYDDHSKDRVCPGMTFAIEPFGTDGKGLIYENGEPTIFSFLTTRPLQSELARLLMTKIKAFNKLPFAIHDLIDGSLPFLEIQKTLKELVKARVIVGYPPLVEQMNGMVAQAENSVLVDENGQVFITTR
jgi:methionyl aminopeptidase